MRWLLDWIIECLDIWLNMHVKVLLDEINI